jgi:tRNA(Ile)-lysidine synthase
MRLLPEIRRRLNVQVETAVLGLADQAREENAHFESLVDRIVSRAVRRTPGGKIALALKGLEGYDTGVRRRLLRRCVQTALGRQFGPDRVVIERLMSRLAGPFGRLSLPDGVIAESTNGTLYVYRKAGRATPKRRLDIPGTVPVEPLGCVIEARLLAGRKIAPIQRRGTLKVRLDLDQIELPLEVRGIRPGDRFRPLGLRGSKKLGDFLTDRKVPRVLRDEIVVVADRSKIVWVAGHEIDDRVKVGTSTKKVVEIEINAATDQISAV